jgi:hypothetical protein
MAAKWTDPDVSVEQWQVHATAALDECATASEWIAAARQHPDAIGLSDPEFIDEDSIYGQCALHMDTAVCRDAVSVGMIEADLSCGETRPILCESVGPIEGP